MATGIGRGLPFRSGGFPLIYRQPRGLKDVVVKRLLRAVRVTGPQRVEQRMVASRHAFRVMWLVWGNRWRQEPGERMQCPPHLAQNPVVRDLDHRLMKASIERCRLRPFPGLGGGFHVGNQRFERFAVPLREHLAGASRGVAFDQGSDRRDVLEVPGRKLRNDRASPGPPDHQTFMVQPADRLPDRSPANSQMASDGGLTHAIARPQRPLVNPFDDHRVDVVVQRPIVVERSVFRPIQRFFTKDVAARQDQESRLSCCAVDS